MENISDRIIIDDKICNGKPVIRGTRITVQSILEFLSAGDTAGDVLSHFPGLQKEDVMDALKVAARIMGSNYSIKPVA